MKKLGLVFLVFFLSACTVAPKYISENKTFKQRQQQLAQIKKFKVNGQFSLITPTTQVTGNLIWNQCNDAYHIQLFGPLGLGSVRIMGNQNQIVLQNDRHQTFTAQNPEYLMKQQLGWSLPLSELKYWIKGQIAQAVPSQYRTDEKQQVIQLRQYNWFIQYQAFEMVDSIDLPVKIRMNQGQVFTKLAIDEWKINFCETN